MSDAAPSPTHRYAGENLAVCGAEVGDPCPACQADPAPLDHPGDCTPDCGHGHGPDPAPLDVERLADAIHRVEYHSGGDVCPHDPSHRNFVKATAIADEYAVLAQSSPEPDHEQTLRDRGWMDEYEAATAAAMNYGEGQAAERARIAAAVEERRDHENSLALRPDIPRSVSEDAASRATAYAAVLAIVKEPV